MRTQVHHLVRRFTARASKMRSRMDLPPTPSSSAGSPSASPPQLKKDAEETDDNGENDEEEVITVNATTPRSIFVADNPSDNSNCLTWPTAFCGKSGDEGVLDPQG